MNAPSFLDDFVLATLIQAPPKAGMKIDSILKADTVRLLEPFASEGTPRQLVEAALGRLVDSGHIGREGSALALTEKGRRRALTFLQVPDMPARTKWDNLVKGYLVARALGVSEGLSKEQREKLMQAEGLRAEVLRQHLGLQLAPVPGVRELKNAVGWALLADGTSAELIERARRTKPSFAAGTILDLLCLHAAGVTTFKPDLGLRVLAAHAVAARNDSADELRRAVLAKLFAAPQNESRVVAPAPGKPVAQADTRLRSFAERVRAAAHSAPSGRFGDRLVFISHVWQELRRQGDSLSLEQFKAELAAAYRARDIVLTKADMPQTLDQRDLAESRITDHDRELVFLELSGGKPS